MTELSIERMGQLGIVGCRGRMVSSEAALELRRAVMSLRDVPYIVLDLSEVITLEGGSLGMLVFLGRWAHAQHIEMRVFNPRKAVRERLDLMRSIQPLNPVSLGELMSLLAEENMDTAVAA